MNAGKTGWPPGLLQDDNGGLSKWLASRPGAREQVRRMNMETNTPPAVVQETADLAEHMRLIDEFAFAAGKSAIGVSEDVQRGTPDHAILKQGFETTRAAVEESARRLAALAPRQPLPDARIDAIARLSQNSDGTVEYRSFGRRVEHAHDIGQRQDWTKHVGIAAVAQPAEPAKTSAVNKCAVSGLPVTDVDACGDCDPCLFGQPTGARTA